MTQLFAVTGNPILHSKSPNMFNSQFEHIGLDASYIHLMADSAEEAIFLFKQLGLKGMNVTSPFKETIAHYLDVVHDEAHVLECVNTVVEQDGKLHGYNTDFYGVIQSFIDAKISLKGKSCLILGAGGAGKAAAYGLHQQGANVTIVNRTFAKSEQVAKTIGCQCDRFENLACCVDASDIIISALQQNINPIEESWLREDQVVFDANYKGSLLIEIAKRRGCTIVSAEDWLLNQAVASYKLFLNEEPNISVMRLGLATPTLAEKPRILSTIGVMGAGKTSHCKKISDLSQFDFVDVDDEIVRKEGCSIPEIFTKKGESYFRELEASILEKQFDTLKPKVLSCGGGIVLNENNRNYLKKNSLVVWFFASPQIILKRTDISQRPLLQGGNPKEKLTEILTERRNLYAKTAHVVVSTEQRTLQQTSEKILHELEKIWKIK